MTTPNAAELIAIYQHIKANPETWNQYMWGRRTPCGTAYCLAGWAVARSVGVERFAWEAPDENGVSEVWFVTDESGNWADSIRVVAQSALGLTGRQTEELFHGANDLDDLRRIITEITGTDPENASVVTA